jgi:hypothetical protein
MSTRVYDRVLEAICDYADRRWARQAVKVKKRRQQQHQERIERLIELSTTPRDEEAAR